MGTSRLILSRCAWEHVSRDFCFNRFMVLKETVEKARHHPACVVHACVWKLGPKNRTPPDVEETYVYILSYHIYTYIYFLKNGGGGGEHSASAIICVIAKHACALCQRMCPVIPLLHKQVQPSPSPCTLAVLQMTMVTQTW